MKAILAAVLLVTALPAQARTLVVDIHKQQGWTHTTVAGAIASARDGDKVVIRNRAPHQYMWPPELKKALTFQGWRGRAFVWSRGMRIHSIAAGKSVVFRDVMLIAAALPGGHLPVFIDRCGGTVVFDEAIAEGRHHKVAVRVVESGPVVFRRSDVRGRVVVDRGRVVVEGGSFYGPVTNGVGEPSFELNGGRLSLANATLRPGYGRGGEAIHAKGGEIVLRGDECRLYTGQRLAGDVLLGDQNTRLLYDPSVDFFPTTGGRAIVGVGTVEKRRLPELTTYAITPRSGEKFDYRIYGDPRANYVVFLGVPGPGLELPGHDLILIDTRVVVPMASGILGTGQQHSITMSKDERWSYMPFVLQGVTSSAGRVEFTNPLVLNVRR